MSQVASAGTCFTNFQAYHKVAFQPPIAIFQ